MTGKKILLGLLILSLSLSLGCIQKFEEETTTLPSIETTVESERVNDNDTLVKCIGPYNITPDTIVFYHSNQCGWCNKMKPVVEKLQNEGYSFHWAEVSDAESMEVIKNCFRKQMTRSGVPQFICTKNAEIHVGATSEKNLKKFADECIG